MAVGTRRKGQKLVPLNASIPQELAFRFENLCIDRTYQRPVYGLRSQIITQLLEAWCHEREAIIAEKQEKRA